MGYNAFFVQTHMHYEGLTVAQNDAFWIERGLPPRRHRSSLPAFLRGPSEGPRVQKLVYHCKLSNNFAPILRRLGYADEEVMCGKIL